jgi:hypothetical protein
MSVQEVYEAAVRPLPLDEQRRLATYIAWQCAKAEAINYSDEWSDEDMRDATSASIAEFERREEDEERFAGG